MGLTVHFKLRLAVETEGLADLQARWAMEAARKLACSFKRRKRVDGVGPLTDERATLRRYGIRWLKVPVPGEPGRFQCPEFWPVAGLLFEVDVGRSCEPLRLALCRYPATVWLEGRELSTRCDRGWCFSGFSKTQFASVHGWEHFLRCHRAVVELLVGLRPLGFRVKITDEGDYWPHRSVSGLREQVNEMNALVAAAAGALKDGEEPGAIESPIFQHPHFERLEAVGAGKICRWPARR